MQYVEDINYIASVHQIKGEKQIFYKEIIEKWYKALSFPTDYDKEFYSALNNYNISDSIIIENYNKEEKNGKRNLLSYLFMCENLKEKYKERKISEDILYDTLKDIVIWTNIWSDIKGEIFLGELDWLSRHLSMKLFKLGRLQFCMGKAEYDIRKNGIKKGENIIEIHIPEGEPLDIEECKKSVAQAEEFFERFFPEFEYKGFTCHSWLLDKSLKELLGENSNIIKFQNMFEIVFEEKSDAILKYVFKWDTKRRNVADYTAKTSFSKAVKEAVLSGHEFYESYGILKYW